jgi:hypothetical protein
MSEERSRSLAVARRAGSGGAMRWDERRVVRKCGEGVGRPDCVRARESCEAVVWVVIVRLGVVFGCDVR